MEIIYPAHGIQNKNGARYPEDWGMWKGEEENGGGRVNELKASALTRLSPL